MTKRRSWDEEDRWWRENYSSRPYAAGRKYEELRSGYRYGYERASDRRHAGRDWTALEPEARRGWEAQQQGTWEEFKDTVRYAWEKVRGRR